MPYIYSLSGWAYHKDYTIMRALVMDFQDTAVANIGDQYLYGPSLLINPVYTYGADSRQMYLPAGQGWYNLYSSEYLQGGQHIKASAPYGIMPVFVKEGSIIPTGPALQYTSEKPADPITLFVYTGKDATFSLYEDGDTTYDYEKGLFSNILFTYSEANKTLTINDRKGSFPRMLANRTFHIVWITKDKPRYLDFDAAPDAVVRYTGKKLTVTMK